MICWYVVDFIFIDIRKVNEFDELLLCDYEGLDEVGVFNFL